MCSFAPQKQTFITSGARRRLPPKRSKNAWIFRFESCYVQTRVQRRFCSRRLCFAPGYYAAARASERESGEKKCRFYCLGSGVLLRLLCDFSRAPAPFNLSAGLFAAHRSANWLISVYNTTHNRRGRMRGSIIGPLKKATPRPEPFLRRTQRERIARNDLRGAFEWNLCAVEWQNCFQPAHT